jgi:hypothetical protein
VKLEISSITPSIEGVTMIALERAIEVAEHNGWWRETTEGHGPELTVFDGLSLRTPYGIRLTVEQVRNGFRAQAKDGVGTACITRRPDRLEACRDALDGYLTIVNHGI